MAGFCSCMQECSLCLPASAMLLPEDMTDRLSSQLAAGVSTLLSFTLVKPGFGDCSRLWNKVVCCSHFSSHTSAVGTKISCGISDPVLSICIWKAAARYMNNSRISHAHFGLMQQLCFQSEILKSEVIHRSKKCERLSEKKKGKKAK